ncbi:nucleotidyl transferase AbiEii/AbiGii toxin family protein [Kutzneria buriramensis]|uniref:Nucleotidyltransferase AbiEii toxin of type IV toxin-antitoxin system n=1 Tax=Kutzneria buriramensis TaxID=1045776 RepID=A0A3E0GYD3_9PSEU|nr:nucleotidyl transferase AbiEii/AbiGii toxin family protein [Kutzneria buriramensis]REH33119.1 nucleotidyltransferase AbiEii toxin of type IV toxin-antitoxin system [Kutzneria buriramensis]
MFAGDFEIHLTGAPVEADALATFAQRAGAKYTCIELNRGAQATQPMLTITASGTLDDVRRVAQRWAGDLATAGLRVLRTKIEAAPWNEGVPRTDDDHRDGLYFEHHVKVLLPSGDLRTVLALTMTAVGHDGHVSRNARRRRADGREERFVTQRCRLVGLDTARARLDGLLNALRGFEVLEVEQEYVVVDDAPSVDVGWSTTQWRDERLRAWKAGREGFPATYRPLAVEPGQGVWQQAIFDPALKQYSNAYRAGDPWFADAADGKRWIKARRDAMGHVLATIAESPWAQNLVLRGSIVLKAWLGEAAREPGDLDFVVVPRRIDPDDAEAEAMRDGLVERLRANPGPGLRADQAVAEEIWTYERVPGRRLVIPFDVPDLPQGAIQLDFVYREPMPEPPEVVRIPPLDTPMLAAPADLSLAWKLQWLVTDLYPQGKDLYDAVLLAEHATVSLDLVRRLLKPEIGRDEAEAFTARNLLELREVDWENFRSDQPGVDGSADSWLRRLVSALERDPSWR